MADPKAKSRSWLTDLLPDDTRMRCTYTRLGKRIVRYSVQIEVRIDKQWRPVIRYDNAHGFCHRDTIHFDGTQDKTPVFYGTANETFTQAIEELGTNWETHRLRYLREFENA